MPNYKISLTLMALISLLGLLCTSLIIDFTDTSWLKQPITTLTTYHQTHFWQSIGLYVFIYALVVALSLPFSTLLSVLGGFLFGVKLGLPLILTTASLSSLIPYAWARILSNHWTYTEVYPSWQHLRHGLTTHAFYYILSLRVMPLVSFIAINLASGFFRVPVWSYWLATVLGMAPASLINCSLGASLQTINSPDFTLSPKLNPWLWALLFCASLLIGLPPLLKHFKEKQ